MGRKYSVDPIRLFLRTEISLMNDIDDDRDELAFAQLDLARYQSMLALGVADVRWQFETVLQDQHLLRRVSALFGVPDFARDGYQNDPTGIVW
jgi:hypothetical protein